MTLLLGPGGAAPVSCGSCRSAIELHPWRDPVGREADPADLPMKAGGWVQADCQGAPAALPEAHGLAQRRAMLAGLVGATGAKMGVACKAHEVRQRFTPNENYILLYN